MDKQFFDDKRMAEGYAKDRPFLHAKVIKMLKEDLDIREELLNGLDVGCGGGLSTKALKMVCSCVTGTDFSEEMVRMARQMYPEPEFTFQVNAAEDTNAPENTYDIVSAAGMVNWVDQSAFLKKMHHVLKQEGILFIYDFWIGGRMEGCAEFADWWQQEYLKEFPRPPRKEFFWTQEQVDRFGFRVVKQYEHTMTCVMDLEAFVRFMLLQSNVKAKLEEGRDVEEVRSWFAMQAAPFFGSETRKLLFDGYNWYFRLQK